MILLGLLEPGIALRFLPNERTGARIESSFRSFSISSELRSMRSLSLSQAEVQAGRAWFSVGLLGHTFRKPESDLNEVTRYLSILCAP